MPDNNLQATPNNASDSKVSTQASQAAPFSITPATPAPVPPMPSAANNAPTAPNAPAANVQAGASTNPLNRKVSYDPNDVKQTKEEFLKALGANVPPTGSAADAIKEQVDIYVMPKEFQHHNRVAGGNPKMAGFAIILIGFIAIVISVGAIYMYLFQPDLLKQIGIMKSDTTETANTPNTDNNQSDQPLASSTLPVEQATSTVTSTATSTVSDVDTLKTIYLDYSKALQEATTFNDYYKLIGKFGSDYKLRQAEASKAIAEASTDSAKILRDLKLTTPVLTGQEKFEVIPNGSNFTLKITLADGESTGQVDMVQENSVWKIDNETWNLKTAAGDNSASFSPAEDRDNDQLTDAEEDVLGSKKDVADTDGDGYTDGSEVVNLYNPTAKNQIVSSDKIRDYKSDKYHFSVLYPSDWSRNLNDSQDTQGSVEFRNTADDHLFQVLIIANENKESIDDYYMRTLKAESIDSSLRRSGDGWQGILSKDGLTFYATDIKKERIYIFQYVPGKDKVLKYPHLFLMMIKSLVIK